MKSSCAILSLLALSALGTATPLERIIGGSYTSDGDYPEMVSVFDDPLVGSRKHLCGGIIVNDNHVITTATCVKDISTQGLKVMAAGSNLDAPQGYEEFKNVNEIFIHEGFDPSSRRDDLAVLRTKNNFVFVSGLVTPAVLPVTETPEPSSGSIMTAVGWGKDSVDGELQRQQKAVNMTYLSQAECEQIFGLFMHPNEGCLKSTATLGVCTGDEGGVVQDADGVAQGMISWHIGCNDYPGVITRLAPYYEWIVAHFDA